MAAINLGGGGGSGGDLGEAVLDVGDDASSSVSSRIQLWQFLFKLLMDKSKTHVISWCGPPGVHLSLLYYHSYFVIPRVIVMKN